MFFLLHRYARPKAENASECELISTELYTRAHSDVREAVDDLHVEASQKAIELSESDPDPPEAEMSLLPSGVTTRLLI